jgi:RimJ/RimL family protein N-acetyltransferase
MVKWENIAHRLYSVQHIGESMNFILKEMCLEQIQHIVNEADENNAFLAHKNEPDFKVMDFLKHFEKEKDFHIFALIDGISLAGFISVLPTNEEHVLSIGPMYICQKYQGMGLGKKQVAEVVKWAKSKQFKRLYTKTWGQNFRSIQIFESLGFIFVTQSRYQRVNGDSTVKYVYDIQ